jgi:hypothetical protein
VRVRTETDLLAILGLADALGVAAVEGKVDESFGPLVSEWLTDETHKRSRLSALTNVLGLAGQDISRLHYQLLHRTASAVYEAQRYRASTALMLVHSFSTKRSGWTDFATFLQAIDLVSSPKPNEILGPKRIGTVEVYAAWLMDNLPAQLESELGVKP